MRIVKVKICGITCPEDAQAAVRMGADIVGLNFYDKSPRYLTLDQAARIAIQLPAMTSLAGVFVNASTEFVRDAVNQCYLDWIQLHGDETPEYCQAFKLDSAKVMKAFRIKDQRDMDRISDFSTDAVLLDAFHSDRYGGTGQTFDWGLLNHTGRRVFLAGGITPENVRTAVELGVYGIDICSGIESAPGKKDHQKMQALFDNIREADNPA